jgi:hypothetical protein
MENNYTVYKHIFPNNKIYIGITKRKPQYRWNNGNGYKSCPLMNKAINKYGWKNVKHEILFTNLTKEQAEEKEIQLIKEYKCNNRKYGYNIENGGNCCGTHSEETKRKIGAKSKGNKYCLGRHISKEHIQKLHEGRIKKYKETGIYGAQGYKHTEEYKKKMSQKLTGIKRNETTKKKLSEIAKKRVGDKNPMYGRKQTEETKRKISESHKGKKLSEERIKYMRENAIGKKKVNQYDLDGNFIKQWDSIKKAGRSLNIFPQNIGKVCRGQQKYAKGYVWRYADDN